VTAQMVVPFLIAAGNVSSAWCTGRHWIAGWPILLATQLGFIAYAAVTAQPGFWVQNIAMAVIAVINWRRWYRQRRKTQLEVA
jgi:hypothetical protein